jgi:zinc D-Ala-D-Ala carboxypeptidase
MNWKHFSFSEFTCKCGCGGNDIDASFVDKLDKLRDKLGFPFIISSGYRCPDYNEQISGTGRTGPHTTGRAADILCDHEHALEILTWAFLDGFRGFGVYQKGGTRFIHLDDCLRPYKTLWTY